MTVHVQLRIPLSDTSVIHGTSTSIEKVTRGECCVYLKQVSMDIKWTDRLVELGEEKGVVYINTE